MVFFQPMNGGRQTDGPPKPERPRVTGWDAWNGLPNRLDPAYPEKNGFPFPPEVTLGGFLFGDEHSRDHTICPESKASGTGGWLRSGGK